MEPTGGDSELFLGGGPAGIYGKSTASFAIMRVSRIRVGHCFIQINNFYVFTLTLSPSIITSQS